MLPFIKLYNDLYVPTYFLVISILFMICTFWLFLRSNSFKISQKYVLDVCLIVMISGFLGGRILHVLYEHPDYYLKAPLQIFKFWQGGFVFYGGLFLSLASVIYYLRKKKQNILLWFDLFTPVIIFGYIMGRFATLLSGSGYGKPTSLPWGIVYPPGPEAPAGIALHPTPIYSMLWNLVALFVVMYLQKKSPQKWSKGKLFFIYGIYHSLGRIIVESFRDDFRGDSFLTFSVSSWLAIVVMIISLYFFFKKPVPQ
jgi:phosphatidylglycerol:prolipoprotein diacylglycerol transferase